jgi:hypothetical protein
MDMTSQLLIYIVAVVALYADKRLSQLCGLEEDEEINRKI